MAALHNPPAHFGRTSQLSQPSETSRSAVETKKKTSTPILLTSSAIAGGVEALATYPFEYAKTRVQLQPLSRRHHNPFSVLFNVTRREGVGAVYTGCSALVAGTAFKVSVRFASFSYFRTRLVDEKGVLTPGRGILAGSLAGLVESVVAVTPTERVKTLLIDQARASVGSYRAQAPRDNAIMGMQSVRSLYRGLVPTVLKQSSTQGVKMGSYNVIRELSRRWDVSQNGMTAFVTGALAGTITVYVTQPFDTIKTWAQSMRGAGTVAAFRGVVQQTGFVGLWSGSTSRVGRLAFSTSILYTVYEKVVTVMNGSLEKELFVFTPIPNNRY
ncbi:Tricarboxylate transport protein 1 [Stagonosporopsis vannaccii]|nr:Tricarboxylate transport protein 1 [Stagonosporopsis vannaccii]